MQFLVGAFQFGWQAGRRMSLFSPKHLDDLGRILRGAALVAGRMAESRCVNKVSEIMFRVHGSSWIRPDEVLF